MRSRSLGDQRSRQERGQSIVIFALGATFLVLMVALVVDAGFNFLARRQLRNAADAASRAGANYLAQATYSDTQIKTLISSVAQANGCTDPCSVTARYIETDGDLLTMVGSGSIPSGAAGVKVEPERTITGFLTGITGQGSFKVSASASAIFGALGTANCGTLFPSVINGDTDGDGSYDASFTIGACYFIKDDDGSPGGGSFGWVDLNGGGGGSSELAGWINSYASSGNTGCNTNITVGAASANLETETGTKASLQSAVLNMVNSVNNEITIAIYDSYGKNSGTNPCTDGTHSGSNLCYRVKGFARVRITDVWLTTGGSADPNPDTTACSQTLFGSNRGILGQFVGWVDPNGSASATAEGPAKVVNIIQ